MTGHLSPLDIARRIVGSAPAEAEGHVRDCAACRAAIDEAVALGDHFRQSVLPRTLPAIEQRPPGRWLRLAWPALATAAVAAGLLFLLPRDPDLRAKGGVSLEVYGHRDGRVFVVGDGARLAPEDQIRFAVAPGSHRYLMIASVDGEGQISIYHPWGGSESAPIAAKPRVEIPGSVVLDASRGPERIFALLSDAPLRAAEVKALLGGVAAAGPAGIRAVTMLPLPVAQASRLIEK